MNLIFSDRDSIAVIKVLFSKDAKMKETRGRQKIRLLFIPEDAVSKELAKEQSDFLRYDYDIDIKFANTREEALNLMINWTPSVVVLDLYCPHFDTLKFLEEWKGGLAEFVALGTSASSELIKSLREKGAISLVMQHDPQDDLEFLFREICCIAPNIDSSPLAFHH
jgi:CheY-like chemotaxis protein